MISWFVYMIFLAVLDTLETARWQNIACACQGEPTAEENDRSHLILQGRTQVSTSLVELFETKL